MELEVEFCSFFGLEITFDVFQNTSIYYLDIERILHSIFSELEFRTLLACLTYFILVPLKCHLFHVVTSCSKDSRTMSDSYKFVLLRCQLFKYFSII